MGIILYNNTISYAKLGGSSMSLKKKLKILELDPYLEPYKKDILLRTAKNVLIASTMKYI